MCVGYTPSGVASGAATRKLRSLSAHPARVERALLTHQDAARGLVDRKGMQAPEHRDAVHRVSRAFSHPEIIAFYRRFAKELERRQYPFHAFTLYRDKDRQRRLHKAGGTRHEAGQSPHNYGMAMDLIHSYRGFDLKTVEWNIIGAIGKEIARKAAISIVWGGDLPHWNPEHWELAEWRLLIEPSEPAAPSNF